MSSARNARKALARFSPEDRARARETLTAVVEEWERIRFREGLVTPRHWTLVIDLRPRRRMGQCRYRVAEVALTWWHLLDGTAAALDTLRHEVAHALNPGDGHGRRWKATASRLGATPSRCGRVSNAAKTVRDDHAPPKWRGSCACGRTSELRSMRSHPRYRLRRCRGCGRFSFFTLSPKWIRQQSESVLEDARAAERRMIERLRTFFAEHPHHVRTLNPDARELFAGGESSR